MKPTKEEQIQSIIMGIAYKVVEKYIPKENTNINSYAEVFNVTKSEIFDYIKMKYKLIDLVYTKPSSNEGFYAIQMGNKKFYVYELEHNIKFNEVELSSLDEVLNKYIDFKLIGNGLLDIIK